MDSLIQRHLSNVEKHRSLIFDAAEHIWKNPETGYREWKTHNYLKSEFLKLGYSVVDAGNIPGFIADIDAPNPGPKVAILAELDSLICETHPEADPETKAVHSCGHNAQCAALLGIAAALKEPGALDGMAGSVRLIAVPAEELIEIEYRESLKQSGVIQYYLGKTEFMHRGLLDGVDIALLVHQESGHKNGFVALGGSNGCVAKKITFKGVSSHAGSGPHLGVNALYAASLGLGAINAIRETFEDDQHTRVHPIITYGGTAVNAIPDTVTMESFVRGANVDSIASYNARVNRALAASAASIGARVLLSDRPGYAPLINDPFLCSVSKQAMECVVPKENIILSLHEWESGSTDMGDISCCMPVFQPYVGGAIGMGHGNNYYIGDVESACVNSAKYQVVMLEMLLGSSALNAKRAISEYRPRYSSIKKYLQTIDRLDYDIEAVTYHPDGTIQLKYNG